MPKSPRESLQVLRAQVGDREALDALLRSIQRPLYSYLCNLLQDSTVAQDALQDVFVLVCRKLKTLRDPEHFRAWVYRIASREALRTLGREKRWRRQARDARLLDQQVALETVSAEDAIDANAVTESLSRLSPAVRAVVALHYLEGMSLREVGAILGLPIGTVKSRLAYGLQRLRNQWSREA